MSGRNERRRASGGRRVPALTPFLCGPDARAPLPRCSPPCTARTRRTRTTSAPTGRRTSAQRRPTSARPARRTSSPPSPCEGRRDALLSTTKRPPLHAVLNLSSSKVITTLQFVYIAYWDKSTFPFLVSRFSPRWVFLIRNILMIIFPLLKAEETPL